MTHVDRECGQKNLNVGSLAVPSQQPVDGRGMTNIMNSGFLPVGVRNARVLAETSERCLPGAQALRERQIAVRRTAPWLSVNGPGGCASSNTLS